MNEEVLKSLIRSFHVQSIPQYFMRKVDIPLHSDKIITLIGPRRSGKTSQFYNLIHFLLETKVNRENILYLNFEDERLLLKEGELSIILEAYQALYPHVNLDECYFFFDEIQNVPSWDKFIRRLYDTTTKNIFITGSNAKLLSKEIATNLRGRTLTYEIFPFSFKEFCEYKNINEDFYNPKALIQLKESLNEYLYYGGFPEIITQEKSLKIKILQEYFNVMMYRDIVERYEIKQVSVLKFFLKRMYSSVTKSVSIQKIYNELTSSGYKLSKDLLYHFLEMTENIYLLKTLRKCSPKLIHTELGEKKIYVIDNGLLNAMVLGFSEDKGKSIEQVVFQQLLRGEHEVLFYKEKYECDFVLKRGFDVVEAIQVSTQMKDPETRAREFRGLLSACEAYSLTEGTIITFDEKGEEEINGVKIHILPLYEFLLKDKK